MLLLPSWLTVQPPANEKLTGTAKSAEAKLEVIPGLADGETATGEGVVTAADGSAAAAGAVVTTAAGVGVPTVPPQAASAITVAHARPIARIGKRGRCIRVTSRVSRDRR